MLASLFPTVDAQFHFSRFQMLLVRRPEWLMSCPVFLSLEQPNPATGQFFSVSKSEYAGVITYLVEEATRTSRLIEQRELRWLRLHFSSIPFDPRYMHMKALLRRRAQCQRWRA